MENDYFRWLKSQIEQRENHRYDDLLEWLFYQDFYSILPMDENRARDGEALRMEYGIQLNRPCSMFEMLIALARRMNFVLQELSDPPNIKNYFWGFIENLGLDSNDEDLNYILIRRFLERRYERNGKGGLFPLNRYTKDQRGVEIWYQMMSYVD